MEVSCEVSETDLEGEHGRTYPGIVVTCEECGHTVQSFGTGSGSIRRCLAILRNECPLGQDNYYVTDDDR